MGEWLDGRIGESNLADMYSKCWSIVDSCKVFEEMPFKDEVLWNAMIDGYAKNGDFEESLIAFNKMLSSKASRNRRVYKQHAFYKPFGWWSFLGACMTHTDKDRGKHAAEQLMKLEPEKWIILADSLIFLLLALKPNKDVYTADPNMFIVKFHPSKHYS
ncbi:hypothetical protein RJ639_012127 [Escallonia herrerae]|uniref:Pentatricopeptide repeat-containing protein n=1 Tax=Escallonia herrerae TaxID=1293975 RepID=A0AA89APY9_9ASTE|nr:hypothetical protein RJ639_012127 [Escallonia herrerae]